MVDQGTISFWQKTLEYHSGSRLVSDASQIEKKPRKPRGWTRMFAIAWTLNDARDSFDSLFVSLNFIYRCQSIWSFNVDKFACRSRSKSDDDNSFTSMVLNSLIQPLSVILFVGTWSLMPVLG